MQVPMQYHIAFGSNDCGKPRRFLLALSPNEAEVYTAAVKAGKDPTECEALQPALERAYRKIEARKMAEYLLKKDADALVCAGLTEVEPDIINALVRERDPHTLAYFRLTGLSDAALDRWDAHRLDRLPLIRDFEEDFVPTTVFDEYLLLTVTFADPGAEVTEAWDEP